MYFNAIFLSILLFLSQYFHSVHKIALKIFNSFRTDLNFLNPILSPDNITSFSIISSVFLSSCYESKALFIFKGVHDKVPLPLLLRSALNDSIQVVSIHFPRLYIICLYYTSMHD